MSNAAPEAAAALKLLDALPADDARLTAAARQNLRRWLTEPRYARYAPQVAAHIQEEKWKQLDDVFYTVIPFGTGGRRGRMYPIGSNAINDRTIGESAAGLATYVQANVAGPHSCAIAYDTRHNSRHFAELCARIMVAAGFTVYFLDEVRSTPELSFLVRHKRCTCGIMVTASHNPPSDNAVKVYWSTGGQILPPHDKGIIDNVMNVDAIDDDVDFQAAVADGRVVLCKEEVDAAFQRELVAQAPAGPRDVKIIYSPLHGVGETATAPVLAAVGFADVEVFGPHREPSGDFPNVPDHVANPENPAVFAPLISRGQAVGAHVALASDPDCDRLGVAAPISVDTAGPWGAFTGNQIGVLMADFVLEEKRKAGALSPQHYVVETLVTTQMVRRIAESYGVQTVGDLLVGFKYIGGTMEERGADKFVFGCEESHGYLVGQYARDKDGAVAAMLMACLAAKLKSQNKSLHEKLDDLYWQHGYHAEDLVNQKMEGSAGMEAMRRLMTAFRDAPPAQLAGMPVRAVRDYQNSQRIVGGQRSPLEGPVGDMVILDLDEGNYVAVRPSGTEPKVKFYMFAYVPAEQLHNLDDTKQAVAQTLQAARRDLSAYVNQVADG
ncbi:MAG: phospho-sugar mutase [Planctomycetales bacterium]|nr:phospho-sugar mutase [Planctomycetales bacterium]